MNNIKNNNMTNYTIRKLNRVILAVQMSPNKSVERAALWARLQKMRDTRRAEVTESHLQKFSERYLRKTKEVVKPPVKGFGMIGAFKLSS